MLTSEQQLESLDDLRNYVHHILCQFEHLEVGAFRMTEQVLLRNGSPCGLYFCLHGPRSVRFSAIWETQDNTVLFYNSSGQRFQKTRLMAAPSLHLAAA